jgi:DNA polymerase-3 subunit alpha
MSELVVPYFELHSHTTYSFLDGYGLPEQVAERLQSLGAAGCAITDHGSVFGHIHFYHAMRKAGLKPIMGCEFYMCQSLTELKARRDQQKESGNKKQRGGAVEKINHITVMARTQEGYANLLKLFYLSHAEGFYYRPQIDPETLIKHNKGLIVLSGCLGSRISQRCIDVKDRKTGEITPAEPEIARQIAAYFRDNLEQFYMEILPVPGLEDSRLACRELWKIAHELQIPAVCTTDAHFPAPENHKTQDAMLCVNYGQTLYPKDGQKREYRLSDCHYHCDGAEVVRRMQKILPTGTDEAAIREAVSRSVTIAEGCDVELPRGEGPAFHAIPNGMSPANLLKAWVGEGSRYREGLGLLPAVGTDARAVYDKREAYELDIIRHHQFENYFLVVADIMRWAKKQNIWGIARGSAGGSLLCYYLGITQIDPIKNRLPVERFIDYSRNDMPDIDIDFDARYRERVFTYLEETYGLEHTAQIAALSTYRARQSVRDICDVCLIPPHVAQDLVRLLPELGDNEGGIKARGFVHRLFDENPKAQALLRDWPDLRLAAEIEGQVRQSTIHAAGFVVDRRRLSDIVGLIARPPDKNGRKFTRIVACDKDYAALQGLLKIDALSVKMLSAVSQILDVIGHDHDWLYRLPMDDTDTYQMLADGHNQGVFQIKGHSAGKLLTQLKPTEFNDLVALAALARPGPLQSGGADEYIQRKHGRQAMPRFHDKIAEILDETYGVVIYQEQVMEAAMKVGGLEVADAHKIRKLISKSQGTQALEKYHAPYLANAQDQGIPAEQAEHVWVQCQKAGNYVFNKAHGAQYAQLGYWSAFLKRHHPAQFTAKVANWESKAGFQRQLLREFTQNGGRVVFLDPHKSQRGFSVLDDETILGGFNMIKGCGPSTADDLMARREREPYRDWNDLLRECPGGLQHALVAAGVLNDKLDLDVVLALAPWFVQIEFNEEENKVWKHFRCQTAREVSDMQLAGLGYRTVRVLGRITDLQWATTKGQGKAGQPTANQRVVMTVTDPTGSVDVWFAAWKWSEIEPFRKPLNGPLDGIGNTVLIDAQISVDGERVFGEDCMLVRESKGFLPEAVKQQLRAERMKKSEQKLGFDHPEEAANETTKKARGGTRRPKVPVKQEFLLDVEDAMRELHTTGQL